MNRAEMFDEGSGMSDSQYINEGGENIGGDLTKTDIKGVSGGRTPDIPTQVGIEIGKSRRIKPEGRNNKSIGKDTRTGLLTMWGRIREIWLVKTKDPHVKNNIWGNTRRHPKKRGLGLIYKKS